MLQSFLPVAFTAVVAFTEAEPASVAWRGDFETGDRSQWSSTQMVAPDRLQVVSSHHRQGQYSVRVEVRQGDDPINASGDRAELVKYDGSSEGREYYYGWSTLWPSAYPLTATWQVFMQWHHPGSNGGPPVRFVLGCSAASCGEPLPDTMFFIVDGRNIWTKRPVTRGVWHDFVLHIKWSANPAVGFVELWYDGQLVVPKRFTRTLYSSADTNYLKMGLYREESTVPTQVLYHDAVVQATSYAEAAPGPRPDAGTPPPPDAGTPPPPPPDAGQPDGGTVPCGEAPLINSNERLPGEVEGGCQAGYGGAMAVLLPLAGMLFSRRRRRR